MLETSEAKHGRAASPLFECARLWPLSAAPVSLALASWAQRPLSPPTSLPRCRRAYCAHRGILTRVVADDPGTPRVAAGEVADVVHLPVDHEPSLLLPPGALRHLLPSKVARLAKLGGGRDRGGHRVGSHSKPGRGSWSRRGARSEPRGSARQPRELRERRAAASARPETAVRAQGFQHPWRGPPSSAARAPIG